MSPRGLEQTIDHSGSRVRAFFIDSLIAADLNNSFEAGGPSAVLFFHGVRGTYEVKHVTRAVGPPASARRPASSCRLPDVRCAAPVLDLCTQTLTFDTLGILSYWDSHHGYTQTRSTDLDPKSKTESSFFTDEP